MSFHQKIPALSLASILILGLTGCSGFITLKDTSSPESTLSDGAWPTTPRVTSVPEPAPAEEVFATPAPEPEDVRATPVPEPYSPDAYDEYMSTQEENLVRTNANNTLARMLAISRTPEYRKLLAEIEAIPKPGDRVARKKVLDNNRQVIESMNQVYSASGDYDVYRTRELVESDESLRDSLVVSHFSRITNEVESGDEFMEVTPGAVAKQNGKYYIKSGPEVTPNSTVALKKPGSNVSKKILWFESVRLEDSGKRFVFDI